MKILSALALALFLTGSALVCCCGSISAEPATSVASEKQDQVVIPVKGMTCAGCSAAVRVAVKRLDGVVSVEVDHEKASATVVRNPEKVTVEQIVEAINRTGFKASPPEKS